VLAFAGTTTGIAIITVVCIVLLGAAGFALFRRDFGLWSELALQLHHDGGAAIQSAPASKVT